MNASPQPSAADWNRQGLAFIKVGRFTDAADCFRKSVKADPGLASARNNLGATLVELRDYEPAVTELQAALALGGDHMVHHNLGVALRNSDRAAEAVPHFHEALRLMPNYPDAHNNLGIALLDLGQPVEAVECFRRALAQRPGFALAFSNLGNAYCEMGRANDALRAYAGAIKADPAFADVYYNLGNLLSSLRRQEEALECFKRSIQLKPSAAAAHLNLGVCLAAMRRRDEAIASFTRAVELEPGNALARAQRMHFLARNCDWDALAKDMPFVPELGVTGGIVPPFAMLAFEDAPHRHRIRSERFAAEKHPVRPSAPFAAPSARPEKLKVGYFSADYSEHAVMHLAAPLFENHDRSRFSVHAYSYGPMVDDGMRRRLVAAFDSFDDVGNLTDQQIAAKARADGLDLAIDLQGYTERSRLSIFAHRAAPLQVTFLGYPGTTGASFMDYMVVDPTIVPDNLRDAYSEKLLVLPHSYQPNDRRPIAPGEWTRGRAGLPETGFVFACFNNNYKITPVEFEIWMDLLRKVEGSVLWLLATNEHVERNLKVQAERRGIDPGRLVFAPMAKVDEHLARHAAADLFLDTFAYSAHTTCSDALWAGLPLVTKVGQGFAARVSASLLRTAGMSELVTDSDEEYFALALSLATDPPRLAAIRQRLQGTIKNSPLFDGPLFARHVETAYDAAFDRLMNGGLPADIIVQA